MPSAVSADLGLKGAILLFFVLLQGCQSIEGRKTDLALVEIWRGGDYGTIVGLVDRLDSRVTDDQSLALSSGLLEGTCVVTVESVISPREEPSKLVVIGSTYVVADANEQTEARKFRQKCELKALDFCGDKIFDAVVLPLVNDGLCRKR